jgi:murein DD-endopeptidase MepM/ murein hydrolase activator NlpD
MRNQIAALFLTVTALTGCTAVDDLTDGNPRASGGAGYMVAVEPGEDLDAVAHRMRVSREALIQANHLRPPYVVHSPQALLIPPPATYRVKAGDTVEDIAVVLGVDEHALAEANGLRQPYHMRVGQVLRVPGGIGGVGGAPSEIAAEPGFEGTAPPPRSTISAEPLAPPSGLAPAPYTPPPSYPPPQAALTPPIAKPPSYPQPSYAPPPSNPYSAPTALAPQQPSKPMPPPVQVAQAPVAPVQEPASPPPRVIEPPAAKTSIEPPAKTAMEPPVAASGPHFLRPVQGSVVLGFGPDASGQTNDGINIGAPTGTPVQAAAAGTVIYAGNELPAFGNLILIRHDGGWVTAYGHLESIGVQRGAAVTQGQTIGKVGQTGSAKSPQLHFEIRQGSKPVDPAPFLTGRG